MTLNLQKSSSQIIVILVLCPFRSTQKYVDLFLFFLLLSVPLSNLSTAKVPPWVKYLGIYIED